MNEEQADYEDVRRQQVAEVNEVPFWERANIRARDLAMLQMKLHALEAEQAEWMEATQQLQSRLDEAMVALRLALPLLQDDVLEDSTICYYCGADMADGGHEEDCKQVAAYLKVRDIVNKAKEGVA